VARGLQKLTDIRVRKIAGPGRYGDGGGLYLQVGAALSKSWIYRFMLRGRSRDMGLGSYPEVSLAEARELAQDCRRLQRAGLDPIEEREKKIYKPHQGQAKAITFSECANAFIKAHRAGWKNEKHIRQWSSTIERYANPVFGNLPVDEVDVELVTKALEPIWQKVPTTANRLRGRIEKILDWAKARGYRRGDNPARWRGHLENLLAKPATIRPATHHPALPYEQIADFVVELRQQAGVAPLALEFLILTGCRTSEVICARWSEVNLANGVWTIPPERIKAKREHRVPLSPPALAILKRMKLIQQDGFVFPSRRAGCPLSNMVLLALLHRMERYDITTHGFRSTFRDWVAEMTNHQREVAEAALAHTVGDKVEAAYRRGDLFEKRRRLMDDWARYCIPRASPAQIVSFDRNQARAAE
jgi:integrase